MFSLALKNLKRNRLRTFITASGIALGTLLVSIIIFSMVSLRKLILEQIYNVFSPEEIIVFSFNPSNNLKSEDLKKIKQIQKVKKVYAGLSFNVGVKELKDTINNQELMLSGRLLAYPYEFYEDNNRIKEVIEKGSIKPDDLYSNPDMIILSRYFYNKLKEKTGQTPQKVTLQMHIPPEFVANISYDLTQKKITKEFKVIGYFTSLNLDDTPVGFIDLKTAKEMILAFYGEEINIEEFDQRIGYNIVRVIAEDRDSVKEIVSELEKTFGKDRLIIRSIDDVIKMVDKIILILGGALVFIGLFSAVVGSLGIINTMIMAVYEQRKEIGILKALGATNWQIFFLYATLSTLIGFIGGVVGLLLSIGIFKLIDPIALKILHQKGLETVNQLFLYDIKLMVFIAGISAFIGFIAGILPALKASKMDPIKAIRG